MPIIKAIHWNTPQDNGKTRCGRRLVNVQHRTDPADATCDTCRSLAARDFNPRRPQ